MSTTSSANAGVHAQTGFEFQTNCALYLILKSFSQFKDRDYHVYLEHHDDVVFCFLDGEKVDLIQTYQTKKASSPWGTTQEIFEILRKITENGIRLIKDPFPKSSKYLHQLHFATNNNIKLVYDPNTATTRPKQKIIRKTISDSDCQVAFSNLENPLRIFLTNQLSKLTSDAEQLNQLDHLHFCYVDLARSADSQKEQLIGVFNTVFGPTVRDHRAAVETLVRLFKGVELTMNQGGLVKLSDNAKRITSKQIAVVIDIITTKQKAYELWRQEKQNISNKLSISVLDRKNFELGFENSFDCFKDLMQVEHQRIRNFVFANKSLLISHTDDIECVAELIGKFDEQHSSQLTALQRKAAVFAAYVELREQ